MFDLHTHSIFSDGELIPSELVRRAVFNGYEAIAITDHVDFTNMEYVLHGLKKLELQNNCDIEVIIGVEITHVPAVKIENAVKRARDLGAELVVVHGETLVEPVEGGTNRVAVSNPSVDILAHPGLISETDVELAKENDVYLEITSRQGHCLANGHVARVCSDLNAKMLLNSDLHAPEDFLNEEFAQKILAGAGLNQESATSVLRVYPRELVNRVLEGYR
ncbi:MAG: histidinol phosphate phosphatase domain-containing protein [Methanophagales archaeon]|nr:histidinol phosphate phosphatase domain-containing protein [Methanophagales archaeon]MCW3137262.1 histidinol phosphate phosphatase domain-containing protein [Methanophagales archaeon]MCW3139478.1 histidinol phosphate phosphatase domain-containing protein [Methanophagales archaeon]MCW7070427.1 histidinol phosphate phosphatase domain-containing protein [Methanophagales archaeon]MCW7073596.1 histidinol phosphate phosphatase domain-containing protein [Methanophagales archaeon]